MSLRYLLDTNLISEPIRPAPNANVLAQLVAAKATVAIASVVWHEVLVGCYRMPESIPRQVIETYPQEEVKAKLPILPYTQAAAEWFARERARLIPIGIDRAKIAAIPRRPSHERRNPRSIDRNHFMTMTTAPIQIPRSHMAKQIVGTERAGMSMRTIGCRHDSGSRPIGNGTIGQLRRSDR
jgi:tRNA(fMet)-specific endonuclease VapC